MSSPPGANLPHVMPLVPAEGGILASYEPRELGEQLTSALELRLTEFRKARGEVIKPEDTHQTIRAVYEVSTRADEFARVLTAFAKRAKGILAEELTEAVGEQDGIPNQSMSVPHAGQKIQLSPKFETARDIDLEPALAGVLALVADEWDADNLDPGADPHGFALEVARRAIAGLFGASAKVQITGIQVLAEELGQREMDSVAASVRDAVSNERKVFKGVDVKTTVSKSRGRAA